MIKIENTEVSGWEPAIRGMRNPMQSWHKSDSKIRCGMLDDEQTYIQGRFEFGPKDLELAQKLCKGGPDDRKFLRMISVYADITAPLYWWKEFDTYKIGTVANSTSTMHKLHTRDLTLDDFSCERLSDVSLQHLDCIIDIINDYRRCYVSWETTSDEDKRILGVKTRDDAWWQMIQLLPASYNQTRTWAANYEVLRNIYHARKAHKIQEWHRFCRWVEHLPYASELIVGER